MTASTTTPPKIPSRRSAITVLFIVILAQVFQVYVWPEISGPARLHPQWNYGLSSDPVNGWTLYQMTGLGDPPPVANHVKSVYVTPFSIAAQTEDDHFLAGTLTSPAKLYGSKDAAYQALSGQPHSDDLLTADLKPVEQFHPPGFWTSNLLYATTRSYWFGAIALAICIFLYRSGKPAALVYAVCLLSAVAAGADLVTRSGHPMQSLGDGLIMLALTIALLSLRRTGKDLPAESDDTLQPPMPFGPTPPMEG